MPTVASTKNRNNILEWASGGNVYIYSSSKYNNKVEIMWKQNTYSTACVIFPDQINF